jgi:creatinine amidohydrolase
MKLSAMNWFNVGDYLKNDDRCILPVGCTEQHAYLSLSTDSILAEKLSLDAAEPHNIPVLPVVHYGHTPSFMDFPGTISVRIETLWNLVNDIIDSLVHHGFRRILIVNGHGGNMPLEKYLDKWRSNNPEVRVKFHNWWRAPRTWETVVSIDPVASHASWMENFEWTRLNDPEQPKIQKQMVDDIFLKGASPGEVRKLLDDGSYGGYYQRSDEETDRVWNTAIAETRYLLENDWDE